MKVSSLNVGDKVKYHTILGQIATSKNHEVTYIDPMPNNFGCDVAWVTGKSGCIDIKHLSPM